MACTRPLEGWYSISGGFTTKSKDGYMDMPMQVPCGQCMGCRLAKTADWGTRMMHEAQQYEKNSFVTLTYNDEKIPKTGTLRKRDTQLFFKRLRKYIKPNKIRYYLSGEYGDNSKRPHYHAIIFNYWPPDCKTYKKTSAGYLFTSEKLEKIWKNGFVVIGAVTYETACYTASYITKKITGSNSEMHYQGKEKEFSLMSRRPGIGYNWYNDYRDETFQHNSVIVNGRERVPPRYYKNKFKEYDPDKAFQLKLSSFARKMDYEELQRENKYYISKNKFFAKNKN